MSRVTIPARNALLAGLLLLAGHCDLVAQPQEQPGRGEYVAILGDCMACHTTPGGQPFAGGVLLPTPLGDIISTNITPSVAGIGAYTLEQFDAAVRRGIRADGKYLYPAMPYTAYAQVTDDDIAAMYDWFMTEVEPSDCHPPPTELPFPFSIRLSMAVWNALFLDDQVFASDPDQSEQWNRGAYLVKGLAHCGTCHTPRTLLMREDPSRHLAGGAVGPWEAPDITSDPQTGIGDWSIEELVQYMQTGSSNRSQAAGPMAEAVDHSLRHVTEADLQAIAVYLQTVPAVSTLSQVERAVHEWGQADNELAAVRGEDLPDEADGWSGAQLFDAYCAACHQASGQGTADGAIPALYHNTATGRPHSNNLALVILQGIHRVSEGHDIRMPGFAHELNNLQVTTLGNHVLSLYGNPDAQVTLEQVQGLRYGSAQAQGQPDLMRLFRIGGAMLFVGVLLAVRLSLRKIIRT
ncbi:MAG: cytochrome c [Pseudomonas sp.]